MYGLPSVDDVRLIIETTLTDEQIEALILDAELIVHDCIADLDEDRQAAIVKYVTADLIASTVSSGGGGTLTSQSLGDASESYATGASPWGKSAYWAKAQALDPNGCLARLGKARASLEKV